MQIRICMGSSCFSRGNKKILNLLTEYISANGLEERVSISGSLCEGRCGCGPHITIGSKRYESVSAESVLDLLKGHI
ncbi:MAG: (2Fe-2S) ferredoxin domain-containing protein [Phycisphaerae bacterium]